MTNGNEDRQFIFNANVKKTQRSTLYTFTCKKYKEKWTEEGCENYL